MKESWCRGTWCFTNRPRMSCPRRHRFIRGTWLGSRSSATAETLLLVGTFGDPQAEGSMAVFGSREAAEEFVRDDPFVNEGVVKAWTLRE
jgi:hypothetical protein